MQLRQYQQDAIDLLWKYLAEHDRTNPCLVLPTGAGKSHVIAAACKHALASWPSTRILMVTHVKELIEQNAEKMVQHWPGAPLGIYSASLRKRDLGQPITFAGVASIANQAERLGHVDLMFVDEAHLIGHKPEGKYRELIHALHQVNPHMRVIGLTATPYRLGHGLITQQPAIFDDLIQPTSIADLVKHGHLCRLRSKHTDYIMNTDGVEKRGGDFTTASLADHLDTDDNARMVAAEIVARGVERKHWLVFAIDVAHANRLARAIEAHGISAAVVTGQMPQGERAETLARFKRGDVRCVVNVNVLSTGFDFPGIDLIAFARPTQSISLYVQQAGRGMRPADGKEDCLVLDFAGNVKNLGPITSPNAERTASAGKVCGECKEINEHGAEVCSACGTPFPKREPGAGMPREAKELALDTKRDIMAENAPPPDYTTTSRVRAWRWREEESRASGVKMITVEFHLAALNADPVKEYLMINHGGFLGSSAASTMGDYAKRSRARSLDLADLNAAQPPTSITFEREGKFCSVKQVRW